MGIPKNSLTLVSLKDKILFTTLLKCQKLESKSRVCRGISFVEDFQSSQKYK